MCVAVFSLFSCKKEDTGFPVITLYSPSEGEFFSFGSQIHVHFRATDDRGLHRVALTIINEADHRVFFSKQFSYSGNREIEENISITINDIHLASGSYTVLITADDGRNEKKVLCGIAINGAPRTLERILVLRHPDTFTTVIDSLGDDGNFFTGKILNGNFLLASVINWNSILHLSGKTTDGIASFSLPEIFEINHLHIPFGFGNDLFTDIFTDEAANETWLGANDGYIRAIDASGNISSVIEAYYPKQVLATEHFIYSYGENGVLPRKLEVFNKQTGQLIQTLVVNEKITGLLPLESEDRILVIRENAEGRNLIPFIKQGNFLDEWTAFHSAYFDPVLTSCIAPNGVVIADGNGIYYYHHNGSLIAYSGTNYHPVSMVCEDDGSAIVWVLEEGVLTQLDATQPEFPTVNTYNTGGNVSRVLLVYNK